MESKFKEIIIAHDMTIKERDDCKELVQEAKQKDRCYVHGAVYRFSRFSMYTATCMPVEHCLCTQRRVRISHRLLNVHVQLIFAVLYVSLNDGTYAL